MPHLTRQPQRLDTADRARERVDCARPAPGAQLGVDPVRRSPSSWPPATRCRGVASVTTATPLIGKLRRITDRTERRSPKGVLGSPPDFAAAAAASRPVAARAGHDVHGRKPGE